MFGGAGGAAVLLAVFFVVFGFAAVVGGPSLLLYLATIVFGKPRAALARPGGIGPTTSMHLLLASDFPNMLTDVVGVPLLFLSWAVGSLCIYHRWRAAAVCFGLVCVLAGGLLYLTVSSGKDYMLTAVVAGLLFITGTVLLAAKRGNDHDHDAPP